MSYPDITRLWANLNVVSSLVVLQTHEANDAIAPAHGQKLT
jgi:hypothetical protein